MPKKNPLILSIDTSCDETSAAVTKGLSVLSNVIWSQSNIHARFGGVVPDTARREHERKISWVIKRAVNTAQYTYGNFDAISVTVGPGLAIALGVGINHAKTLSKKYKKPLIAVNHLEAHLLSPFAQKKTLIETSVDTKIVNYFPAFGLVASGGNTILVAIKEIGRYKILAQTMDDALGESLDKSARLIGLGYPGGAILEKFAKLGNGNAYQLPIPMLGREYEGSYSYSGIKTAFRRLYEEVSKKDKLTKKVIYDLAAAYQKKAFEHFFRISSKSILLYKDKSYKYLLVGGGVASNISFRKQVRSMCKNLSLTPLFPYSKKLYGDNAAMIGVCAYFKYLNRDFANVNKVDRLPNLKINEKTHTS